MADNYLGFTFGSVRVALDGTPTYDGFILNSGDDLKFSNSPEFSNEFASPTLGDHSIYTGTTVSSRTFSFTVVLDAITLVEYREFLKDFWHEAEGYLRFDYADDFGYMVKLSSIGDGSFTVVPASPDTYHIEVSLEFITTGDWAAIELNSGVEYRYEKADDDSDTKTAFNFTWAPDSSSLALTNKASIEQYFILEFNSAITATFDGTSFLNVTRSDSHLCKYYSRYGIVIDTVDNVFVAATLSDAVTLPIGGVEKTIVGAAINAITIIPREII